MDIEVEGNISMMRLIREMRKPEVKQGMLFMLQFVQSMAEQNKSN
jgi:uncharacterized protein YjgD (DUF1641 family)